MDLAEAKVIITGGAKGLGAATAQHMAGQGAKVTIFDMDKTAGALVAASHDNIRCLAVDVTDEAPAANAVTAAAEGMGGITAVVNCAGIAAGMKIFGRDGPHTLDTFRKVIDINLVGSFNVTRLAVAVMSENTPNAEGERGVIVNTASIAAYDGQKGQVAYAASKAGIAGMSLPMARDLGSLGIRVCAIAPGIFRTPMLEGLGPEIMQSLAKDVIFPHRLGRPEEYAQLAAFILAAPYLNGETIRLDGALRMR